MQLYFLGMCLIYIYISDDNLECLLALNFYMAMFGCQMIVSPVFQIFYFFCMLITLLCSGKYAVATLAKDFCFLVLRFLQ